MERFPPADRMAFWNQFGQPNGTYSRVGDFSGSLGPGIPQLWWFDPAKAQRVAQARRDRSMKLDIPPVEDRFWQEYAKTESKPTTSTQ